MPIITVTASVTYEYDTEDGLITTEAAAREDVEDILNEEPIDSGEFVITVTTED